jgi:hypothetical protein
MTDSLLVLLLTVCLTSVKSSAVSSELLQMKVIDGFLSAWRWNCSGTASHPRCLETFTNVLHKSNAFRVVAIFEIVELQTIHHLLCKCNDHLVSPHSTFLASVFY